jgi:hypothetical protein
MVWLYRSSIAAGREGVFYLLKFLLPAFAAATGGGGWRQNPVDGTYIPPPPTQGSKLPPKQIISYFDYLFVGARSRPSQYYVSNL